MRRALALLTASVFVLCSLPDSAPAQPPAPTEQSRGTPPAAPTNLQVLPRNTPRPEVLVVMRGFTAGLGVTCDFCHVQQGDGRNDFARDDLPNKRAARAMLVMTTQINQAIATIQASKTASDIVKVECITCHRGQAIPKNN